MKLKTWASGEVPQASKNLRVACQTGKVEFKYFSSPENPCADVNGVAAPSPIVPGDQVLLKNTRERGKPAPKFETKPYTVLTKERHQVTVKSSEGAV